MGDDRIDELLAELQKLDPDAYMAWCELFHAIYDIDYDCIYWDSFAGAIYLLQGAIQDAISARGWHFDVCYNEETKKYVSLVAPPDNERWLDSIEADAPAESLLATYVAALEAEADT